MMMELSKFPEASWLRGLTQGVYPWKGNETSRSRAGVLRIWGSSTHGWQDQFDPNQMRIR